MIEWERLIKREDRMERMIKREKFIKRKEEGRLNMNAINLRKTLTQEGIKNLFEEIAELEHHQWSEEVQNLTFTKLEEMIRIAKKDYSQLTDVEKTWAREKARKIMWILDQNWFKGEE